MIDLSKIYNMKMLNNMVFVREIKTDVVKTQGGLQLETTSNENVKRCVIEEVQDNHPDGLKKGDKIVVNRGAVQNFHIDTEMNTGFVMTNSILCVL